MTPGATGVRRRLPRGALLLEIVLALAIFVSAGIAILSMVGQGVGSLELERDLRVAADLARSAIARIEAGIDEPEALHGPVRAWQEREAGPGRVEATRETGWELAIETAPSPFQGLTALSVTASRREGEGRVGVSYTLRQLVRLSGREEEDVGDEDELSRAAREGERRRPPGRPGSGRGAQ